MDQVNQTLYIPLYGKAFVSKKHIILHDKKAEQIWAEAGLSLGRKSKSKWLAYYMAMRAAVFDRWVTAQMRKHPEAVILHIGCGLDSRAERVGPLTQPWYDIDFPEVIKERRRFYAESEFYHMTACDVRNEDRLAAMPKADCSIVVMEGVSMYLRPEELRQLLAVLAERYKTVHLLMDCYTVFAAKASKYKNPVNDVGVTAVFGLDDPKLPVQGTGLTFVKEREMTPTDLIAELRGMEQAIFRTLFGGNLARRMYRLYEYQTSDE